jgi:CubicO group peptidase (beta-lactamase class C family)
LFGFIAEPVFASIPVPVRDRPGMPFGIIAESRSSCPDSPHVVEAGRLHRPRVEVPLLFSAGEKRRYSNTGYFVLGQVITRVRGKPWAEFPSERVFRPLKMDATRTTTTTEIVPHRAGGYVWTSGQFKKSEDWVAAGPSGAFLSTVLDLARWGDAVRSFGR